PVLQRPAAVQDPLRVRLVARSRPRRRRSAGARPARRADEPPAARARARAPAPGVDEPDRGAPPARCRGRLAAGHDTRRPSESADLGRDLPGHPRGARAGARGGALTVIVSGEDDAQRAAALLEAQGYRVVIAPVLDE